MLPCLCENLLAYASDTATPVNQAVFRTWKFIDLNAFLKLLGVSPRLIAMVLFFCVVAVVRWVATRVQSDDANTRRLTWAVALSATLVLNIYVGIYDAVLILPSLLLTAGAIGDRLRSPLFRAICVVIYILPWCSQALASHVGLQPFTLAILAATLYQCAMLRQPAGRRDQEIDTASSDNSQVASPIPPMFSV